MIILDTNVVSEIMKPRPEENVKSWFNLQAPDTLHLTTFTVSELLFGVSLMSEGVKKKNLSKVLDLVLDEFKGKILSFDYDAAVKHATLAKDAKKEGYGFPIPDAYIAAIAATKKYRVATRDGSAFLAAGLKVINPWDDRNLLD